MPYDLSLEPLLKRIGDRLWQARHANKEKMASVAKEIHINISVVSQVENGRYHALSLELLSRFAHHYHTSVDLLLSPDIKTVDVAAHQNKLIELLIAENSELRKNTTSNKFS